MAKSKILIAIFAFLVACGCGEGRTVRNPKKIYGNVIALPGAGRWIVDGRDTTVTLASGRPRIMVYYNTKGCTSCRMKELFSWQTLIAEEVDADFVFIFRADPTDHDFLMALRSKRFDHPVLCDPGGQFERDNVLPRNSLHHVFLTDAAGRIVLVGTPIFNPELWEEYKSRL